MTQTELKFEEVPRKEIVAYQKQLKARCLEDKPDYQDVDGMKIRVLGNSIQFITPDGQKYFKKFKSFRDGLNKGGRNFLAPISVDKK